MASTPPLLGPRDRLAFYSPLPSPSLPDSAHSGVFTGSQTCFVLCLRQQSPQPKRRHGGLWRLQEVPMQTTLNILQFLLQFSVGAALGVILWHKAGALLSFLQSGRPPLKKASPPSTPAVEYKITGPHLEHWPQNCAVLAGYGISSNQVVDAKRVTLDLKPLPEMGEVADVVRALHAEGRAPGMAMAQWICGGAVPTGMALVLVLRGGFATLPETWVILVPD